MLRRAALIKIMLRIKIAHATKTYLIKLYAGCGSICVDRSFIFGISEVFDPTSGAEAFVLTVMESELSAP
jgi:hypothetical protein